MTVYVSDLFTATPAPVNASPTSTRTWQWLRGSSAISGATSSTYTAVTADIGSTLSATQLETNFLATTTATSAPTEVVQAFDPIRLFSASEPGVWYDPSDMSTLFQNASGTIPVTSFGQPVGLMLDKSRGLVLGPELVVNGTFDTDVTGWTAQAGDTISVDTQRLRVADANSAGAGVGYQIIATVPGKTYVLLYSSELGTATQTRMYAGTTATNGNLGVASDSANNPAGRLTFIATSTATYISCVVQTTAAYSFFDNISVKELPGLHATQSTEASRPLYGIVPVSGRRNLLTYSEQFDVSAYWTVGTLTVTPNAATAPDGTLSADLLYPSASGNYRHIRQASLNPWSGTYTFSFYAKAAGVRFLVAIDTDGAGVGVGFDLQNGTYTISGIAASDGTTASITPVGDGWYRCAYTSLNGYGYLILSDTINGPAVTTSGTNGVYLWGAQFETGATPTAYQRVSTDLDVTEAGVASVGYLRFDGSTSWMVTPTITPGTDKVQVFAGVRKLSDAASYAMVAELSVNSASNNGSFALMAPYVGATYAFDSKGTIAGTAASGSTFPAPTTNALTALGDISGDTRTLRVNGTQVAQNTGDQGTGNYLAYPLYLGRRADATLPFQGHLFPLIVRFGPTLTAARIAATEAWVATKTGGVTL